MKLILPQLTAELSPAVSCDGSILIMAAGGRPPQTKWLQQLPVTEEHGGCRLFHATHAAPQRWRRIKGTLDAQAVFDATTERICLFGHTHRALCAEFDGFTLLNPGTARASCAVVETDGAGNFSARLLDME